MQACALCGRRLRTPESRTAGMGPVCAKKLAVRAPGGRTGATRPPVAPRTPQAATAAHTAPIPGQTEIPIQTTLWSP